MDGAHFFVEQDVAADSMRSAATSIANAVNGLVLLNLT